MRSPLITSLALVFCLAAAPAQEDKKKEDDKKPAAEVPDPVTKEDSVTIAGKKISYRVTAAKLQLKKNDGDPRASIFHISYERTGKDIDATKRPVLFAFNGGPGSSSVWLHLGALGPKLVPTTADGTKALAPPYQVTKNPHSILDVADLVFIDPVSTGYSRVEKDAKSSEFHGLEGDIESVGDFIRRWISEHDRWASPKFILGESYGGIRAAGLAAHLQDRYGMHLNGVVLLSSLLDFRTLQGNQGDSLVNVVYLPAFVATAHYHGKIEGDRDDLLAKTKAFSEKSYHPALARGSELPADEKAALAAELSSLTGIPATLWEESNLRLSPSRFRKELLRDEELVLGRFDARVAWPAESPASDHPRYDPSYSVAYGAFSTAMLDYLTRELGWEEDHPYEILTGKVRPWDWGYENRIVNVTDRLTMAMRENPSLRVLVQCGHTDLATPPAGIEHSFRHVFSLPAERRESIEFTYYDAGHMFYLNEPDHAKMRKDLVDFITASE